MWWVVIVCRIIVVSLKNVKYLVVNLRYVLKI